MCCPYTDHSQHYHENEESNADDDDYDDGVAGCRRNVVVSVDHVVNQVAVPTNRALLEVDIVVALVAVADLDFLFGSVDRLLRYDVVGI